MYSFKLMVWVFSDEYTEVESLGYKAVWFLIFEDPPNYFFIETVTISISTNSAWEFPFLHIFVSTSFLDLSITAILTGLRQYYIVVLFCIRMMISDVEHLCIHLFAIYMSSSEKGLFRFSAHF